MSDAGTLPLNGAGAGWPWQATNRTALDPNKECPAPTIGTGHSVTHKHLRKGKTMPSFEELMNQFRNPGETGIPETFADELVTAHTEELSVRDAAVTAREADAAALRAQLDAEKAEVLRVKAVNYDLMRAAPKPDENDPGTNDDANNDAGNKPRGIAALFE